MAVFGRLAYREGATVGTLLSVRFTMAAAVLWMALLASGAAADLRRSASRDIAVALALGAVAYAAQAGAYFGALARIDASLLSLLVYTFPAIVCVAAIALGRERADARHVFALALTCGGLVLLLARPGAGQREPAGIALGIAAAVVYSAYILIGDRAAGRMRPPLLSALVCSGAAASLTVSAALLGELHPGALTPAGWAWLACLALVSTVAAIGLFFAGLRRVGPTSAAILSTVEPLVTILLAGLLLRERVGVAQVAGAALLLTSAGTLCVPRAHRLTTVHHWRHPRRRSEAAPT
jgi:drug/metabolite transporter (DMT)-like permease